MRFSQRYGFRPVKNAIQVQSMDGDLKTGLWNVFMEVCWADIYSVSDRFLGKVDTPNARKRLVPIWQDFFRLPLNTMSRDGDTVLKALSTLFYKLSWDGVYDFLEFVAQNYPSRRQRMALIERSNAILERELSGWRFVGDEVAPAMSQDEVAAIETALDLTGPLTPVRTHLARALELLADRKEPDYRNSIKESISAVESTAKLIAGAPKADLSSAVEELEKKIGKLHGALKKGILSLYGYTSDAQGIRHGLLNEPDLGIEDAQLWLVLCSGFVSYLIQKAAKAGVKLSRREGPQRN